MPEIKSYKDLIVWQKSLTLVKAIYKITKALPAKEQHILISQMLRAAISIPSNIAEGWGRNHKQEYIHFLQIAFGSSNELETQILITKDQYSGIDYQTAENLLTEIQKMLTGLIKNIKQHEGKW